MPDSPAHNLVVSPLTDLPSDDEKAEADSTVTFLPPMVSRILMVGWLLLFAGRWLIVQGMSAAGLIAPELVETIDEKVLGRLYLLLLSVTLVTLVVRIVRGRSSQSEPLGSKMDFNAQEESVSAIEGAGEAETSDRGGKQA